MSAFQVGFSRRADRDVAQILEWLKERSPQGARRWLEALEQARTRLSQTPFSFPLAEEAEAFSEPIRQILFRTRRGNTYRALFVIRADEVTILCVRGGAQRPVTPEDI
jgi:plasmid stabilization system protein ParE